jgi:hypothetical protein
MHIADHIADEMKIPLPLFGSCRFIHHITSSRYREKLVTGYEVGLSPFTDPATRSIPPSMNVLRSCQGPPVVGTGLLVPSLSPFSTPCIAGNETKPYLHA